MKSRPTRTPSFANPVGWPVPSGWRIVKVDHSRMAEARGPCCQSFLATSAGHFPHAAGHDRSRPHGAGEFVFAWLLQGSGWCEVNGQRHVIHPGDVMVLGPTTPHAYGYETEQALILRWFHCRGDAAAQMAAALATGGHIVHVGNDPAQTTLHEEALCALEQVHKPGQLSLASQLLSALVAQWTWHRHSPSATEATTTEDKLDQLLRHMRSHLAEPLKPTELAARLRLSPSHFRAVFQRHTGRPPTQWLLETRLDRARTLLRETTLSVKEVAYAVGISDPLYFSRIFTRHFKSPPRTMKRMKEQ